MAVKISKEEVVSFIESHGGKLISQYSNSKDKLEIQCKCGAIFKKSFEKVKVTKRCLCPGCSLKNKKPKRIGELTYAYALSIVKSHELKVMSSEDVFNSSIRKPLEIQCTCGGTYKTNFFDFEKSKFKKCRSCASVLSEPRKVPFSEIKSVLESKKVIVLPQAEPKGILEGIKVQCTYQGCTNEFLAYYTYAKSADFLSCKPCADSRKGLKLEFNRLKDRIDSTGCKLISTSCAGIHSKVDIECRKCQRVFNQEINNFLRLGSYQCQECAKKAIGDKVRLDYNDVKSEIENLGHILYSSTYTSSGAYALEISCRNPSCKNTFITSLNTFRSTTSRSGKEITEGKRYCASCAESNRVSHFRLPIEKIHEKCIEKGCEWLSGEYINNGTYSLFVKFKCQHTHLTSYKYLKNSLDGNCPQCSQIDSKEHRQIIEYIQSLGITNIDKNNRKILHPQEIDIFLPDLDIGIEIDGLIWHTDYGDGRGKDKSYHLHKWKKTNEKEIQLAFITDVEWNSHRDRTKAYIRSLLQKNENKVTARGCTIKITPGAIARYFYSLNHMQGHANSKINLGLYLDDLLVSLMSFSTSRYAKDQEWELTRYAVLNNYYVIGGPNRLFKHFIQNYSPKSIISYCDLSKFSGRMYTGLGFKLSHISDPNYFYYNYAYRKYATLSRQFFQKHKMPNLYKKGILDFFDPELTEWENMQANGFSRYWNCGNKVFKWVPNP